MLISGSDALAHVVDVGQDNEHVEYLNDLIAEPSLSGLDPINQLIILEEMEHWEALEVVLDLHQQLKPHLKLI